MNGVPLTAPCCNVPRSVSWSRGLESNTISSSLRLRPLQIAREDAARVGQIATSAAAAIDRLDPAGGAARSDQNRDVLLRAQAAPAAQREGPLPRPKPSITSPAMPRSIIASSPRRSTAEREPEHLHALLQSIDLERSAQQRPPMNDDLVAVHLAKRTVLVRLECFDRAGVNLGHVARRVDRAVEANHSAQAAGQRRRRDTTEFSRLGGPSDCGSSWARCAPVNTAGLSDCSSRSAR